MSDAQPQDQSEPRTAVVVLVTPDGAVVGSLPELPVATPWWQEVEPVVSAVRDRHGFEITVLRLLSAEREEPHGGRVTYLAEVPQPVPADPWPGTLDEQPRRHAYAKPGGPAADLAWANAVLAERGHVPAGSPAQVRSWNLSSLWRIPVAGQTAWLKVVPGFFAHEGALLARLAGERVPVLLGHDGGRSLLAEIPGEDLYGAGLPQLLEMVSLLVGIQCSWRHRLEELLALGLPDWRESALSAAIADVAERTADELSAEDRASLARFLRGLPDRFRRIAGCGIGDTLIHGDFYPGNFRGDENALTLLDWSDSGVGHPLLDQPAFLAWVADDALAAVQKHWLEQWREAIPGSDPARAAKLLGPIAAARQAATYRRFLDCIEPAEAPYHRSDPASWLRRAALLFTENSNS
ncbi:MAG: phosphotransferase family protein [Dongiaceae bacterium]